MGFFSHAAMLGVGYWIGKSYCFRYKVHELQNEPQASEFVLRVERKGDDYPFWGHPWWHHHHCHWVRKGDEMPQKAQQEPKSPELLEVKPN